MYLITKWFGTFLCDKSEIKEKILFPRDFNEIAEKLQSIENNEILQEEQELAQQAPEPLIVAEKRLEKIGDFKPKEPFFKSFKIDPEKYDFSNEILVKASKKKAKQKIREKFSDKEVHLIQAVNTLDDLQEISNLLDERVTMWNKMYDELPEDGKVIAPITHLLREVNQHIKHVEKEITKRMKNVAPNLSILTGELIGARLIAQAGSLKRLASFPSSTVQILGAEKALFRFKKEGGKPPKHGIIFQHHLIRTAKRDLRGKIARGFAGKISTAAKADAFTGRNIGQDLKEAFVRQVKMIKRKHS